MRFDAAKIKPTSWKNGGGTTRELAMEKGTSGIIWRVSLAEILQDGPFSVFAGLSRVHTIVAGEGLSLCGAEMEFKAKPLKPLAFEGALVLDAQLVDGPCRAVNVIYDPRHVSANAQVCTGAFSAQAGDLFYVINGRFHLCDETFTAEQGCVLEAPAQGKVEGEVLHVQIRALPAVM